MINWEEKDKLILLKRIYENGFISYFEFVREGFNLFKEAKHQNMEERLDFDAIKNKYSNLKENEVEKT